MRALREEDEVIEIPMTPLIDIVFLLLIFFLVATNFSRKEIDQKVTLPTAEGGTAQEEVPEKLVINVRKDGAIVVNGSLIEEDALRLLVGKWHQKHPRKNASIRGDGGVPYQKVMRIMGICKALGVSGVDLPVEDSEPTQSGP